MVRKLYILLQLFFLFLGVINSKAQTALLNENFDKAVTIERIGRGICRVENGVLLTQKAYARFGEFGWKDYSVTFKARTPKSESHVEIWAGFRGLDRYDRYVVGFRGGEKNDLFLARMGYMGADEFLGRKELDFSPETGKWYNFRIEVCGSRIRIFIGNESVPRIDFTDHNGHLASAGKVILGGGWLNAEYDDLRVSALPDDYLKNTPLQ